MSVAPSHRATEPPVPFEADAGGFPIRGWEWPARGGDQDVVVLLHGFLDHGRTFAPLMQAVPAGSKLASARVIAPDFRGHGASGRVGAGGYYYFTDYIGDLARVVAGLPGDRLALVAHSMGGSVAWMYGGAWPERVQAMVVMEGLGPPEADPDEAPGLLRLWVEQVDRVREKKAQPLANLDDAAARLRAANSKLPELLAYDLARHGTEPAPGGGLLWRFDPLHRTRTPVPFEIERARAFWRRVACPVLYLEGADTSFRLYDVDERLACFQQVEKHVIADAGHMMHHDQPAETARLISAFLDRALG